MLSVKNISFNYPDNTSFKGISNVSFDLKEGNILTILGKSGGGKSTLLKCIYGLVDITSGSITFNSYKVLGPAYSLIPGHSSMKLVSQEYYVLENNTVKENVYDALSGYADDYKEHRTKQLLKVLELQKFSDRIAKNLSSGQRQRLSIARALADFPKLLLLDEPFSNLDAARRDRLFTFIKQNLKANNACCIFVTHHAEEAIRYANSLLILEEGKIKFSDVPRKAYKQQDSVEIAKLFGRAYTLTKKDFVNHKGIKFYKSQLILRPANFKIVANSNKNAQLKGLVKDIYFAGTHDEVKIKLHSNKIITASVPVGKFGIDVPISLILDNQ